MLQRIRRYIPYAVLYAFCLGVAAAFALAWGIPQELRLFFPLAILIYLIMIFFPKLAAWDMERWPLWIGRRPSRQQLERNAVITGIVGLAFIVFLVLVDVF